MTNDDTALTGMGGGSPGGDAVVVGRGLDALCDGSSGRSTAFARVMRSRAAMLDPPPLASLVNTIEGEIVPRMMLARRACSAPATDAALLPRDLDELTFLLTRHDAAVAAATALVESIRARGVSLESLCLGLLAPVARRLGALWESDDLDFATVTIALCHLHELLRQLSRGRLAPNGERGPAHAVLLAPVPGEQHTFGLLMVGEFFRQHGWAVTTEYPATTADLLGLVNAERYSMVGLTVGCREQLDGLSARVAQIRRASRHRGIRVLLGGRPLTEQPDLAARLGADATAADAREAARQADHVVGLLR
jgi:methanogenic corrinoid protein MtbC1